MPVHADDRQSSASPAAKRIRFSATIQSRAMASREPATVHVADSMQFQSEITATIAWRTQPWKASSMADKTKIEWAEASWNPFRGCTRVSPGCQNCYAERMAARGLPGYLSPTTGLPFASMTPSGPHWRNVVEVIEKQIEVPIHWRKPRRVFVNSMSDTFHERFMHEQIAIVVDVAMLAPQHSYLFLTKRADRAREFWVRYYAAYADQELLAETLDDIAGRSHRAWPPTPFDNVWMGVSAEDQQRFDERIEDLRATPAAIRWLSLEPLLGPIDLAGRLDGIHWVVVGGESGPGARPCDVEWIRGIVRQCREAGVAVFVKQLGRAVTGNPDEFPSAIHDDGDGHRTFRLNDGKGGDPAEWPTDLRVREVPNA